MDALAAGRLSPVLMPEALRLEQERQARLLAAIWAGQGPLPAGWAGHRVGLRAHQRHARATAPRALAGAYPVLASWLGDPGFDDLAWWLWQQSPPPNGDLGTWGGELPRALAGPAASVSADQASLAHLEWAVHRAARAADPVPGWPTGLAALHATPPDALWLWPQAGLSVVPCRPQALARWQAAQSPSPSREGASPLGAVDWVLVRRVGWQVAVRSLSADQARFTRRLLAGDSLGQALTAAAPANFQDWLRDALAEGWWRAVNRTAHRRFHDEDEP